MFPATKSPAGISFHQIDLERSAFTILNVINGDQQVDESEIVKGFEYSKGKYLLIEPKEIRKLRLETKSTIDVAQFVDPEQLPPYLFEKPYFMVSDRKTSSEGFAVMRHAMGQANKVAIGEVAFAGREHLIAIALHPDKKARGLMAYTLRYGEELRDAKDYFTGIEEQAIDKKHLASRVN